MTGSRRWLTSPVGLVVALAALSMSTAGCTHHASAKGVSTTTRELTTTTASSTTTSSTSTTSSTTTSEPAPDIHSVDFQNAVLPADSCGGRDRGWEAGGPIALVDGVGWSPITDEPDSLGAGIMATAVVGYADFDGDGTSDALLQVLCAGTSKERCCASRAGLLPFALPLRRTAGGQLQIIGSALTGGGAPDYGRVIHTIELVGTEVVTTETIIYPEGVTEAEAGFPPDATVTTTYTYRDGAWTITGERW